MTSVSRFHHVQGRRKRMGSISPLLQKRQRVHSDAVKASQNVSVFLSCAVKSTVPPPVSVAPSPVLLLSATICWPCRTYHFYSNGLFHQLAPILKTPIPEILRTIMLMDSSPISVWLSKIAKRLSSRHTTWLHAPYVMTLQASNTHIL